MHVCVLQRYYMVAGSVIWRHQGDTWRDSPLPVAYSGDHRPAAACHSAFVPCRAPTPAASWERGSETDR